ncbi:hypothetical protein ES707_01315 [subsurface metagenome]
MANPQLEDGYTEIANEILEALMKTYLPPNQWQVLMCIVRKTYGFKKKVDWIANCQIVEATELVKSTVSRALAGLEKRGLIIRNGRSIGFQKDWEKWEVSSSINSEAKVSRTANSKKLAIRKQKLADRKPELAEQSTKVSSPRVTQKKKETIQKKLYKRKYGEFQNVLLTDEEYQKLKDKLGSEADRWIEEVSRGKAAKGYKYKSDYAAILNWQRRDKDSGKDKGRRLPDPKEYEPTPDYPDLR